LKMTSRNTNGARVVVDAAPGGSLRRFVNHSCLPNCRFEERQHRATRRMVIVTERQILPGEEITVLYNKRVSFTCLCGEENCQSNGTIRTAAPSYING
jgi:SET domain-containing protein